jgi:hypothetical protein
MESMMKLLAISLKTGEQMEAFHNQLYRFTEKEAMRTGHIQVFRKSRARGINITCTLN